MRNLSDRNKMCFQQMQKNVIFTVNDKPLLSMLVHQ